jgi:hypothetical protein
MFGGRFRFAWFSLGILLLLGSAKVQAENRIEPTDNVNLSPIQSWRSTYFCLYYKPMGACGEKHKITVKGLLEVTEEEINSYCDEGCLDQSIETLDCIYMVNTHFSFTNNATVRVINETINHGCTSRTAINTTNQTYSSAMKVGQKIYVPLISTLVFIAMFKM